MTIDELIIVLRESAESDELSFRYARKLLNEAADRLEELDERVSIMNENMTAWELFELLTSAYGGKQIFFRQKNGMVYDRYSGEYVTFDEAIERFTKLISDEE